MGFLQRLDNALRTKDSRYAGTAASKRKWGNEDLDPTPPDQRTWKDWNYVLFWWAIAINPTQWNTGSSLVNQGLLWWQAIISVFVSNIISSVILSLQSRGPAVYHIGYPAYVRVAAGMYGSLFFIALRCVVAIIYYATQTFYAAQLLIVMLRCAFGHNWTDLPNHLPKSAGITSSHLGAFFLLWFIQLPVMMIHPRKAKWLYNIKSVLGPAVLIAIFGYVMGKNSGLTNGSAITKHASSSSAVGWAFMAGINSAASGLAPEIFSNADLARYARRPSDTTWSQPLGTITSKTLMISMGIASASASLSLYGEAYWNIWDLLNAILDHNWNAGARTAIFLACLIQIIAVFATNLAANCLPVGSDLTGLFPRYFNIVRGQMFCAFLSLVCVPWKMINSAQNFLTFLGSYVCFLGAAIGVMITDYYIIRRGNIHIPSLYNGTSTSPYWYYRGCNVRMFVAWAFGVAIVIHGLSGSYSIGAAQASKEMYSLGFLLSIATSSFFYWLFCRIWTVDVYPEGREDESKSFEILGNTDGHFEDEVEEQVLEGVDRGDAYYRGDKRMETTEKNV